MLGMMEDWKVGLVYVLVFFKELIVFISRRFWGLFYRLRVFFGAFFFQEWW